MKRFSILLVLLTICSTAAILSGCTCKGCLGSEEHLWAAPCCEIRLGMTESMDVTGSRQYSAVAVDPDIATAAVDEQGGITVTGRSKGTTTITVTDLVYNQSAEIAIEVTDFYFCLFISGGTDDDKTIIRRNDELFLRHTAACEYALMRGKSEPTLGQFTDYELLQEGRYALTADGDAIWLSLTRTGESPVLFNLSSTETESLDLFRALLRDGAAAIPEDAQAKHYLRMKEMLSGETFQCRLAVEISWPKDMQEAK
ncbi:pilus assembly protein N-terminal domain-containing protein [uncultured Alistipes sp.]|uniref:pilus assembly protein N-terminal domain-containing protein n=1 Tax=uncultured Alistipes sp. TaxID=538949 RepID=UPI0025D4B713|nr:pilus assembly protein N-terminal domain-containing protein [uncultured Alistipes sp.]